MTQPARPDLAAAIAAARDEVCLLHELRELLRRAADRIGALFDHRRLGRRCADDLVDLLVQRQRNLLRTGRNQLFFNPELLRQQNGHTNGNGHKVERVA